MGNERSKFTPVNVLVKHNDHRPLRQEPTIEDYAASLAHLRDTKSPVKSGYKFTYHTFPQTEEKLPEIPTNVMNVENIDTKNTTRNCKWIIQFMQWMQVFLYILDRAGDIIFGCHLFSSINEDTLVSHKWKIMAYIFIICGINGQILQVLKDNGAIKKIWKQFWDYYGKPFEKDVGGGEWFYIFLVNFFQDLPCSVMTILFFKKFGYNYIAFLNMILSTSGTFFWAIRFTLENYGRFKEGVSATILCYAFGMPTIMATVLLVVAFV